MVSRDTRSMEQVPYWPQKIVLLRTSLLYCYTPTYHLRVVLVWSKSKANTIEENRILLHLILKESNKEKTFSPTKIQNSKK